MQRQWRSELKELTHSPWKQQERALRGVRWYHACVFLLPKLLKVSFDPANAQIC